MSEVRVEMNNLVLQDDSVADLSIECVCATERITLTATKLVLNAEDVYHLIKNPQRPMPNHISTRLTFEGDADTIATGDHAVSMSGSWSPLLNGLRFDP
jgi:hypothetical protein